MAKYDIDQIRTAARGQWGQIIAAVCGLSSEILDGSHHPCPKCGGTDRFRAFDDFAATGGVMCNQCHSKANGDGFSTVQWANGLDFVASAALVGDHLGIAPQKKPRAAKADRKPDDGLESMPWSSDLVRYYLTAKPPITEKALLLAGAKLAKHKGDTVIAFPAFDPRAPIAPVNYVLVNVMGRPLAIFNPRTKETTAAKSKTLLPKAPGFIGAGVEKLAGAMPMRVWKVEGIPDMLALVASMTDEQLAETVVVTNVYGCGEKPGWQADILAGHDVYIVPDLDHPGEAGAKKWAREIALKRLEGATIVRLPGEVTATHGKDLRDWLIEGNTYGALLGRINDGDRVVAKKDDATGEPERDEAADLAIEREICRAIQIEVLGEMPNGSIRVYSLFHRKVADIGAIDRLKYERLLQIGGAPIKLKTHKGLEDVPGCYRLNDVRDAIASIAGYRPINEDSIVGQGIWPGRHLDDSETGSIVLVNAADADRYNGDKVLRQVNSPRVDGLLLDLGGDRPWYDRSMLASNLRSIQENPVEFGKAAVQESKEILSRWRWAGDNPMCPWLMTGCVMASFVQTVWKWRPQIAVSGESNAGKSFLFEFLGGPDNQSEAGLFLHLAFKTSKSTEAGLRQSVQSSAQVVMCDEFEASRERDKVLELIRTAGRGSKKATGTPGQKAQSAGLQHICWVAAIETGLNKQPDRNRFIQFELLRAAPGMEGKLTMPTARQRWDLGHRLLALAVYHAYEARDMAVLLRDTRVEGIHPRYVESYAVPAAMLSLALGKGGGEAGLEAARHMLTQLMAGIEKEESYESDHDDLLDMILGFQVYTGPKDGKHTIAAILDSLDLYSSYAHMLKGYGIKITDDSQRLFIAPSLVRQNVLAATPMNNLGTKSIGTILGRIKGAERLKQRLGKVYNGYAMPYQCWATGYREGDEPAKGF